MRRGGAERERGRYGPCTQCGWGWRDAERSEHRCVGPGRRCGTRSELDFSRARRRERRSERGRARWKTSVQCCTATRTLPINRKGCARCDTTMHSILAEIQQLSLASTRPPAHEMMRRLPRFLATAAASLAVVALTTAVHGANLQFALRASWAPTSLGIEARSVQGSTVRVVQWRTVWTARVRRSSVCGGALCHCDRWLTGLWCCARSALCCCAALLSQ